MVRAAGAREVHVRISCPPTISPCFYGVDTPRRVGADCRHAYNRRDPRVPRSRQRRLSEPRGAAERGRIGPRLVLHVLLYRPLSGRVPARRGSYLQLALKLDRGEATKRCRWRCSGDGAAARLARSRFVSCRVLCARSSASARNPRRLNPCRRRSSRPPSTSSAISIIDPHARRPHGAPRPGRAGGSRAASGRRGARRRLRPLSRARPADRASTIRGRRTSMREALTSPNDRLRDRRLQFFRAQPGSARGAAVARRARQGAGGVRPAGAGSSARCARGDGRRREHARASGALARSGRGEDFFRSAVIEALGDYRAPYAVRRAHRQSPSSTGRCRTMRRWRWARSATSARWRRWPGFSEPRRGRRSRRSPPPSACSASIARSHENYLIDTLKFADKNIGFQELLRSAAAGLGALGVAGRAEAVEALIEIGIPSRRSDARAGRAGTGHRGAAEHRRSC